MARQKGEYGAGSISESGENRWRLRYRVHGRRFSKTVRGTRSAATKELRSILKSADDGLHVVPNKITFAQWSDQWLKLKARKLAGQTLDSYTNNLNTHVVPVLGAKQLQKITANDIDKLYNGLTLAPSTMALVHFIVKTCFKSAVKKKLIATNPADDAEKPTGELDEDIGVVLDEDQLATLVAGFKDHNLYPIVAVAAFTGMRKGEVLALRWVDVDFDAKTISITRSVQEVRVRGANGAKSTSLRSVKKPKTKRAVRTIQVDDGLVDLLRAERTRHQRLLAGLADGEEGDVSDVILPTEALCFPAIGTKLTALRGLSGVYSAFIRRATKLGFDMRFHDLRGTHSTILLDKGVPVHVVAKRIGDDPAILLRRYAKRTKKADTSAANIIGTMTKGVL